LANLTKSFNTNNGHAQTNADVYLPNLTRRRNTYHRSQRVSRNRNEPNLPSGADAYDQSLYRG
jgi:hypothetical protein